MVSYSKAVFTNSGSLIKGPVKKKTPGSLQEVVSSHLPWVVMTGSPSPASSYYIRALLFWKNATPLSSAVLQFYVV
jgi:hypothetical protein